LKPPNLFLNGIIKKKELLVILFLVESNVKMMESFPKNLSFAPHHRIAIRGNFGTPTKRV
jgi:hypothetical protein